MRFLIPVLAIALMTASAEAQVVSDPKSDDPCAAFVWGDSLINAADPTAFAEAWSNALRHFELAIPDLSPDEAEKLQDKIADWRQAYTSPEYAHARALHYARTLWTSMREITAERDRPALIGKWLAFVDEMLARGEYEVVAGGETEFVARAIANHVMAPGALPPGWAPVLPGETAFEAINRGQRILIHYIVRCTLPALGVGSHADIAPR